MKLNSKNHFQYLASAFMFRINSVVIMETNDFSPSQQEK